MSADTPQYAAEINNAFKLLSKYEKESLVAKDGQSGSIIDNIESYGWSYRGAKRGVRCFTKDETGPPALVGLSRPPSRLGPEDSTDTDTRSPRDDTRAARDGTADPRNSVLLSPMTPTLFPTFPAFPAPTPGRAQTSFLLDNLDLSGLVNRGIRAHETLPPLRGEGWLAGSWEVRDVAAAMSTLGFWAAWDPTLDSLRSRPVAVSPTCRLFHIFHTLGLGGAVPAPVAVATRTIDGAAHCVATSVCDDQCDPEMCTQVALFGLVFRPRQEPPTFEAELSAAAPVDAPPPRRPQHRRDKSSLSIKARATGKIHVAGAPPVPPVPGQHGALETPPMHSPPLNASSHVVSHGSPHATPPRAVLPLAGPGSPPHSPRQQTLPPHPQLLPQNGAHAFHSEPEDMFSPHGSPHQSPRHGYTHSPLPNGFGSPPGPHGFGSPPHTFDPTIPPSPMMMHFGPFKDEKRVARTQIPAYKQWSLLSESMGNYPGLHVSLIVSLTPASYLPQAVVRKLSLALPLAIDALNQQFLTNGFPPRLLQARAHGPRLVIMEESFNASLKTYRVVFRVDRGTGPAEPVQIRFYGGMFSRGRMHVEVAGAPAWRMAFDVPYADAASLETKHQWLPASKHKPSLSQFSVVDAGKQRDNVLFSEPQEAYARAGRAADDPAKKPGFQGGCTLDIPLEVAAGDGSPPRLAPQGVYYNNATRATTLYNATLSVTIKKSDAIADTHTISQSWSRTSRALGQAQKISQEASDSFDSIEEMLECAISPDARARKNLQAAQLALEVLRSGSHM